MKLDKKDLPKLIALGVLAVACVGIVTFQFASPGAAPKPASPAHPAAAGAAAPTGTVAKVTVQVAPPGASPDLLGAPIRRDPFIQRPLGTESVDASKDVSPRKVVSQSFGKVVSRNNLSAMGSVPPLDPWGRTGPSSGVSAVPALQPKDPDFMLTGVVRGDRNVAIIRSGPGGRYVVKQGQLIDGRYRVISVSDDSAVLADKTHQISVTLGGKKNGS